MDDERLEAETRQLSTRLFQNLQASRALSSQGIKPTACEVCIHAPGESQAEFSTVSNVVPAVTLGQRGL